MLRSNGSGEGRAVRGRCLFEARGAGGKLDEDPRDHGEDLTGRVPDEMLASGDAPDERHVPGPVVVDPGDEVVHVQVHRGVRVRPDVPLLHDEVAELHPGLGTRSRGTQGPEAPLVDRPAVRAERIGGGGRGDGLVHEAVGEDHQPVLEVVNRILSGRRSRRRGARCF